MQKDSPYIICIEGNIGAGKSSLLDAIESECIKLERKDILILREPVDVWDTFVDNNGKTTLENYYENPTKYAFMFQVLIFTTISKAIKQCALGIKTIICERSLLSSHNVFAKMLRDEKLMTGLEYQIYESLFQEERDPDMIIYIDVPPTTCLQRINKRNRNGESNITINYLIKCQAYYRQLLDGVSDDIHIFRIDVTSNNRNSWVDFVLRKTTPPSACETRSPESIKLLNRCRDYMRFSLINKS